MTHHYKRTLPPPGGLHLSRVKLNDTWHDAAGFKWAPGPPLWHAWSQDPRRDCFVRAETREAAKAAVRDLIPGALFNR